MKNQIRIRAPLIALALCSACASFKPNLQFQDLMKSHQPTAMEVREGLGVSVEEFASPAHAKKAFDADLAPYGVLALFLRMDNKSAVNFQVQQREAKAFLGDQPLPNLRGIDAANQAANSDAVGKAAAWTVATGPFALLLWPATISLSARHTQEVNRTIEHHFENLEFGDVLLRPGQKAGGFLYFKLPEGVKELKELKIKVTALEEQNGKQLDFQFFLPPLELSAPVSTPGASNTNGESD